jgi:hypothetical protein
VMTGIGHPLPNVRAAMALPWQHKHTGLAATAKEIRETFERVSAQASGRCAAGYQFASDLVLPAGFASELAIARLDRHLLPGLRRLFAGFDGYPLPARRALVDLAYDLGIIRLGKYRNLIAACAQGDFRKAADHCHRWASRDNRNQATRNLFLQAAGQTIE